MKVIVTCGPSFEPIDQVRRLTNFSTGELGVLLSEFLTRAGYDVFCFKGTGATYRDPVAPCHVERFDTNDDLLGLLAGASASGDVAAVFHAAALCDYRVKRVDDESGQSCHSAKIASRSGALTIRLEPATKVISKMRGLFPRSVLVGWKYELAGTRQDALGKAYRQIEENDIDACVVNGRAYGDGFGLCQPGVGIQECELKADLPAFLVSWWRKGRVLNPFCRLVFKAARVDSHSFR